MHITLSSPGNSHALNVLIIYITHIQHSNVTLYAVGKYVRACEMHKHSIRHKWLKIYTKYVQLCE